MERKILIEFNGNIEIRYDVAKRLSEIGLAPAYAAGNSQDIRVALKFILGLDKLIPSISGKADVDGVWLKYDVGDEYVDEFSFMSGKCKIDGQELSDDDIDTAFGIATEGAMNSLVELSADGSKRICIFYVGN